MVLFFEIATYVHGWEPSINPFEALTNECGSKLQLPREIIGGVECDGIVGRDIDGYDKFV